MPRNHRVFVGSNIDDSVEDDVKMKSAFKQGSWMQCLSQRRRVSDETKNKHLLKKMISCIRKWLLSFSLLGLIFGVEMGRVFSHSAVSDSLWPHGLYSPSASSVHGGSPGENTGVVCHALFQENFPTQGLNLSLLHCRQILYHLSHHEQAPLKMFTIKSKY